MRKLLLSTSALFILAACDMSPDYSLPQLFSSDSFKEETAKPETKQPEGTPAIAAADDVKWKRLDEKAQIEEFAWWRMFNAPALDTLEELALKDNPSLEVAAQRVAGARANADISESSLYPTVSVGVGPRRTQPANADVNANIPPGFNVVTKPYTTYNAQGSIAYELDLFGKNRLTARAAGFDAEAEANNYRAARLALQSDIAEAYFQRASLKMELDILNKTIDARKKSRSLTVQKRDVGEVDDLDLSTQDTDLANAQSDRDIVNQQLAINEHTLATLVGVAPSAFKDIDAKIKSVPPVVPAGLPSALLERRPDVQSAAKTIASANARIGAARAGYFPDISLSAVGGFTSTELKDLFKSNSKTWVIGPLNGGTMLVQPLFEGGRISGTLDARHADYLAASANYKGTVLQAFREVEDQLSSLQHLRAQADNRTAAVRASKRAYDVASQRYDVGYSSNLEFLDAQRSLLAAQRSEVQVLGQRYIATIQLVKALGGSWITPPAPEKFRGGPVPAPKAPVAPAPVAPAAPAPVAPAAPAPAAPVVEKSVEKEKLPAAELEAVTNAPEEKSLIESASDWFSDL